MWIMNKYNTILKKKYNTVNPLQNLFTKNNVVSFMSVRRWAKVKYFKIKLKFIYLFIK